jgi:hypothetical protein
VCAHPPHNLAREVGARAAVSGTRGVLFGRVVGS